MPATASYVQVCMCVWSELGRRRSRECGTRLLRARGRAGERDGPLPGSRDGPLAYRGVVRLPGSCVGCAAPAPVERYLAHGALSAPVERSRGYGELKAERSRGRAAEGR